MGKSEQPTQEELKNSAMIVSLFLFHLKIASKKSVAVNLKNPALCGPIDTHTWASWLKPGAKPSPVILQRFISHLATKYAATKCWGAIHNGTNDNPILNSDSEQARYVIDLAYSLQHKPWQCLFKWYSANSDSTYRLLKHLNNENLIPYLESEKEKLDGTIKEGFGILCEILGKLSDSLQKSEQPKAQKEHIIGFIKREYLQEKRCFSRSEETSKPNKNIIFSLTTICLLAIIVYYAYGKLSHFTSEAKVTRTIEDNGVPSEPADKVLSSNVDALREQRVIAEIKRVLSDSPQALREPVHERIWVETVPQPTSTNVELIDYWVIWDLRGVKELSSLDIGSKLSPAVQRLRQRVVKMAELDFYRLPAYTSGIDIFSQSHSMPLSVYASDERNQIAQYTVKPRMLEFDVSDIPVGSEFNLDVTKTYWNAFQNKDQSWVGITTELPTLSIDFLVIFPDDRPYKTLEYFATDEARKRIDIKDSKYVIMDKNKTWISWHIEKPRAGYGYHIDWEW